MRRSTPTAPSSAGFFWGTENRAPGADIFHTPAARAHVVWQSEDEKHWFTQMLWGRLRYNPDLPDSLWVQRYAQRFGPAAPHIFDAMGAE